MDVFLVRHAIAFDRDAEQWPDDRNRPLTPDGAKRFKKAARGLKELLPHVDTVLCSELVRAWQTAEILAKVAKWPRATACEALEPGHSPSEVLVRLAAESSSASVALVGHEPGMHELLLHLISGSDSAARLSFKKGGVAHVTFEADPVPGGGSLQWLATPALLRKIG